MGRIYKPTSVEVFQPLNPEYALVDSMIEEAFEAISDELVWWSLDRTKTQEHMDDLGKAYGEASDTANKPEYNGPFRVWGKTEINPIIQELTRLGAQTLREIDMYFNVAAFANYTNGLTPKQGDIVRVTWLMRRPEEDREFWFYEVANVTPVDIYNFRYANWQCLAEQTALNNVPEAIRTYDATHR